MKRVRSVSAAMLALSLILAANPAGAAPKAKPSPAVTSPVKGGGAVVQGNFFCMVFPWWCT